MPDSPIPTARPAAPLIEARNLVKTYTMGDQTVHALRGVSLDIAEGDFVAIMGASGSGKSTLMNILGCLDLPTSGEYRLAGEEVEGLAPDALASIRNRRIGFVFQQFNLLPRTSALENVELPMVYAGVKAAQRREKAQAALQRVGLGERGGHTPSELSGGQQQRVALARALVYDPPVLLMDEPLSALDKKLREEIQHEIRRIHQETGVTILYVTHDQEEALRLSDRIAVFNRGKIEQVGTGPELYANPATHFVADFIGDSAFLGGKLETVSGGHAALRFADGTVVAAVPLHGQGQAGQAAELMLRPERIELAREAGPQGASLPVTVEDMTFLGNATTIAARTGWGDALSVRLNFGHPLTGKLARGDRLHVRWSPEAAHAFVKS